MFPACPNVDDVDVDVSTIIIARDNPEPHEADVNNGVISLISSLDNNNLSDLSKTQIMHFGHKNTSWKKKVKIVRKKECKNWNFFCTVDALHLTNTCRSHTCYACAGICIYIYSFFSLCT